MCPSIRNEENEKEKNKEILMKNFHLQDVIY